MVPGFGNEARRTGVDRAQLWTSKPFVASGSIYSTANSPGRVARAHNDWTAHAPCQRDARTRVRPPASYQPDARARVRPPDPPAPDPSDARTTVRRRASGQDASRSD